MAGRRETGIYVAGVLLGAAAGAAVAYFYATQDGARRRAQLTGAMERLAIDVDEGRRLWQRLSEAWVQFDSARSHSRASISSPRAWPPDDAA